MIERFIKYMGPVLLPLVFFSGVAATAEQEGVLRELSALWKHRPQELPNHLRVMKKVKAVQERAVKNIVECDEIRDDFKDLVFGTRLGLSAEGPLRFSIGSERVDDSDAIWIADGLLALFADQPALLEAAVVREMLLACFEPLDNDLEAVRFNKEINRVLNLLDPNYLPSLKQAFCRVNCATLVQASLQKRQEHWWGKFGREDRLRFLVQVVDRFFEQRKDLGNLMAVPYDIEIGTRVAHEIALIDFSDMRIDIDNDHAITEVCVALDRACAAPSPTAEQQAVLRQRQHLSYGKLAMVDLIASFGDCAVQ